MLIPLWESAPWWQLVCPDAAHFAECVVDWVWLHRDDLALFVAGTTPGRAVLTPDWQFMAVRTDFSGGTSAGTLGKRERCIRGGCPACGSLSWRRQQ